jgi:hypothetical protein
MKLSVFTIFKRILSIIFMLKYQQTLWKFQKNYLDALGKSFSMTFDYKVFSHYFGGIKIAVFPPMRSLKVFSNKCSICYFLSTKSV